MPITYHIDVVARVVFTRGYGAATDKDILEHNIALEADADFDPSFNQLLNFTEVTDIEVNTETIYQIAERRIFDLSSRRAIVVKPGLQFGLARMFKSLRGHEDSNIRLFLDLNEARRWVGLED